MKVLHIYSDYKWTGPAEPTVNLLSALRRRGHDIRLACHRTPTPAMAGITERARRCGIPVANDVRLAKGVFGGGRLADIATLRAMLLRERFDLVHVHRTLDHLTAGFAGRGLDSRPALVRTNHSGLPAPFWIVQRLLLCRFTDGLMAHSRRAVGFDHHRLGFPPDRVVLLPGAVDLERFDPDRPRPDVREEFGIRPGTIVVGIVARMQRHRRFNLLLEAFRRAVLEVPSLVLMIVGRGTHTEEVAIRPARLLGISSRVIFAGYRKRDYESVLSLFDMKVFLVPGSDGSCRAVREAMAMGKPVISTRRGMLPEIVEDGESGFIVDENPDAIARAILALARSATLRRRFGSSGRAKALSEFSIAGQAEVVERFYEALVTGRSSDRGRRS